jgi:hypothetical protein
MGKTFGAPRGTWAVVGVVVLGGCSTILGIDNDYGPAGANESSGSGTGGSSSSSGATSSSGTGGGACVLVDDKNTCTDDKCVGGIPTNKPIVGKMCNVEGFCDATGACITPCLGTLGFAPAPPVHVGMQPAGVTIADFDKDGKLDLAVVHAGSEDVIFLHGNGDGTFVAAKPIQVGGYPVAMVAVDLDVDGNMDLVVANLGADGVNVLWGNGDGLFVDPPSIYATGVGTAPDAVTALDLNGDGLLDLAVADQGNDTVGVLFGQGARKFSAATTNVVDASPNAVVALDSNGDGKLDLAVSSGNNSTVRVLHGNGKGVFVNANYFKQIFTPSAMMALDLNNNNRPDIVVANALPDPVVMPTMNTVSVLFNQGNGMFAPKVLFEVGAGPSAVVGVDLNGDGKPDLAVASSKSNTVSVLLHTNIGPGTDAKAFALALSPPTGAGPDSIATADLNGDGRPDIVTANGGDDTVSILLNTCSP